MMPSQIGNRKRSALLQWEVDNLQRSFLDSFEAPKNGGKREAILSSTEEFIVVRNLPLPDVCEPDYVDVLIVVDNYPGVPPIGLYLLNTSVNEDVVRDLAASFNVFDGRAFHEAQSLEGYTWVCYHYARNQWRFSANAPHKGDNISKFLSSFFAACEKSR